MPTSGHHSITSQMRWAPEERCSQAPFWGVLISELSEMAECDFVGAGGDAVVAEQVPVGRSCKSGFEIPSNLLELARSDTPS
jgi:hypothetical protein